MKPLLIVCASLACALAASGCTNGNGGTATSPFDPFGGPEPTIGGGDAPPTVRPATGDPCAQACANIQAMCPGSAGGADCANQCRASSLNAPPCDDEFLAFVACVGRAQLVCSGDGIDAPACANEIIAVGNCANGV